MGLNEQDFSEILKRLVNFDERSHWIDENGELSKKNLWTSAWFYLTGQTAEQKTGKACERIIELIDTRPELLKDSDLIRYLKRFHEKMRDLRGQNLDYKKWQNVLWAIIQCPFTDPQEFEEVIAELTQKEINPSRNGLTPFYFAVKHNREKAALHLFRRGAEADIVDYLGRTPFHYAVLNKNLPLIHEFFIRKVRTRADNEGNTPWHLLAQYGNERGLIAEMLHHAFYNSKNEMCEKNIEGYTPLHLGILYENVELFSLLFNPLEEHWLIIDPNQLQGPRGRTPIHLAIDALKEGKSEERLLKAIFYMASHLPELFFIPNEEGVIPLEYAHKLKMTSPKLIAYLQYPESVYQEAQSYRKMKQRKRKNLHKSWNRMRQTLEKLKKAKKVSMDDVKKLEKEIEIILHEIEPALKIQSHKKSQSRGAHFLRNFIFLQDETLGRTALHQAVLMEDLEEIQVLLKTFSPSPDKNLNTAWHVLAEHSMNAQLIEFMLSPHLVKKGNENELYKRNRQGLNPIHLAIKARNWSFIAYLFHPLIYNRQIVHLCDAEMRCPRGKNLAHMLLDILITDSSDEAQLLVADFLYFLVAKEPAILNQEDENNLDVLQYAQMLESQSFRISQEIKDILQDPFKYYRRAQFEKNLYLALRLEFYQKINFLRQEVIRLKDKDSESVCHSDAI
jgi:ankyrin repeat protein